MSKRKNMRRISVLVTAQTAYNLDKLVREKMIMLGGQRNENVR